MKPVTSLLTDQSAHVHWQHIN